MKTQLKTEPSGNYDSHSWTKTPDFIFANEKTQFKFLYIGTNAETVQYLSAKFQSGYGFKTMAEAQRYINEFRFYNDKIPDVMFIDVPLDKAELEKFCLFLKQENLFLNMPVIYDDQWLNTVQKNLLKELQLVDDAIHIVSSKIDFTSKIIFLKKIKLAEERQSSVKKPSLYRIARRKTSLGLRRSFDIFVALLCLLLLSPLFILIIIAIKIESKGAVFYISQRAGKGFKIFKFYKFRSMVHNADKNVQSLLHLNQYADAGNGPKFFKINNDPRVTWLGKFLRNTSLDELPQLFNVLRGEMSLVGNRPLPIYEAITLTTNEFVERFSAPAGITGLWQVKKRGKAEMSHKERIELDISYARSHSILYDLKIVAHTPFALFQKSSV